MQLEGTALGETAADGIAEGGPRGAAGLDKDHCLGDGADGDGDDLLVGELADLACAARADMGDAPECCESVLEFLDISLVAAGHDRQRTRGCACGAAGNWGIEIADAAFGEPA